MTERHIVAIGGGGFSDDDPAIDRYVLDLTGSSRPRICFIPTASGDAERYVLAFYRAFPATRFEASDLPLFARGPADLRDQLLGQDVLYVGGGSTANLLAVWRLHGLPDVLGEAWERGIVLAGVSAGANCWFEASTTDSFGPELRALDDGLGLLSGSFCPHYDGEPGRRPLFHRLVGDGFPAGYAADNGAACHFTGGELSRIVRSRPAANAYRVERSEDGSVTETRLP